LCVFVRRFNENFMQRGLTHTIADLAELVISIAAVACFQHSGGQLGRRQVVCAAYCFGQLMASHTTPWAAASLQALHVAHVTFHKRAVGLSPLSTTVLPLKSLSLCDLPVASTAIDQAWPTMALADWAHAAVPIKTAASAAERRGVKSGRIGLSFDMA
jgi:hypothetical protein